MSRIRCQGTVQRNYQLSDFSFLSLSVDLVRVLTLPVSFLRHSTRTARPATLVLWAAPARPVQQVFLAPCRLHLAHVARVLITTWCLAGTYTLVRLSGANACTSCPDNANSPQGSTAATACSCNAGYTVFHTGANGGACSACFAGAYKDISGVVQEC